VKVVYVSNGIRREEYRLLELLVLLPLLLQGSGAQGGGGSQGSGGSQGLGLDNTAALLLLPTLFSNTDGDEFRRFFLAILATQGFGTQGSGTQGNALIPALFLLSSGSGLSGYPRKWHEIRELLEHPQGMTASVDQLVQALTTYAATH
jgi:hypothetical protein